MTAEALKKEDSPTLSEEGSWLSTHPEFQIATSKQTPNRKSG